MSNIKQLFIPETVKIGTNEMRSVDLKTFFSKSNNFEGSEEDKVNNSREEAMEKRCTKRVQKI